MFCSPRSLLYLVLLVLKCCWRVANHTTKRNRGSGTWMMRYWMSVVWPIYIHPVIAATAAPSPPFTYHATKRTEALGTRMRRSGKWCWTFWLSDQQKKNFPNSIAFVPCFLVALNNLPLQVSLFFRRNRYCEHYANSWGAEELVRIKKRWIRG